MNRILTVVSICIISILISCQRPVDEVVAPTPPPVDPPVEIGDSTLLRRVWGLYPDLPGEEDTATGYFFRYDDKKRPLEMIERVVLEDGTLDYSSTLHYSYQGNEQLAYIVTRTRVSRSEPEWDGTDSMFIFYQNGLVSKDSTVSYLKGSKVPLAREINTNTTVGDTLYNHLVELYYQPDGAEVVDRDTVFPIKVIRENGNLVEYTCPAGPEHVYNINRFNDHPNPMYRFYVPFPYEYHLYEWSDIAYKNLHTYGGNGSERLSANPDKWVYDEFTYTYRTDGYPLTATVNNSFGDSYKVQYVYY